MKFTAAIDLFRENRKLIFEAEEDGFNYQICGDVNGIYILLVQGLVDIGIPWFLFDLDWNEVVG